MKRKTLKLATLLLMLPISAFATPMMTIDDTGQLTGATDVNIGGSLYNVSFIGSDSCTGIFSGCNEEQFAFRNVEAAHAASIALLEQVFTNRYDDAPELTSGCTNRTVCYVATPYATIGDVFYLSVTQNFSAERNDRFSNRSPLDVNRILPQSATWAIWSQASFDQRVLAASEPGILLLLGLGLAGIAFGRRN